MRVPLRPTRWCISGFLLGSLVLGAAPVHAEGPTAQARSAARTLAQQADKLWEQNDYAGALDKFTRAFELVGAPSLAVRQAECLEKLGRLVEASEKYQQVLRMKLEANAPDAFRQAVEAARQRAEQLRPRLPLLTVLVRGQKLEGATLTLDGKEVPEAMWGQQWPADPGTHQLVLVQGDRKIEQQVTLEEGKPQEVALALPPPPEGAAEPASPAAPAPAAASPAPTPTPTGAAPTPTPASPVPARGADLGPSSSQPTWGWVAVGVGVAGLAAGTVTAVMLTSQRQKLDEECTDTRCPSTQSDAVDRYNTLRPISTVGFAVGAVGVGAGLVLLFTAPGPESHARRTVAPWVGVGAAGVRGRF